MKRVNFLHVPQVFILNQACRIVAEAFDGDVFLVGSSLERRDYRDVDVRCILADEVFDRLFGKLAGPPQHDAFWSLLCTSMSLYLSQQTDLPIDFQVQRRSDANARYPGPRHALGMFLTKEATR
jgi:hypothetical protein